MIKIYFIVDIHGLVYIGSTQQLLCRRFASHKCRKKNNSDNTSSKLLDLDNAYIECIEECNEDNRTEREQYWINIIDCVNKRNTTFSWKEYRQTEKNQEYRKKYMKEYNKQYYQKNKKK